MKRFILAFIAAYIFIFLWGWLLNGVLLKDIYAQTPNLWRSQSEMMSLFHWIIIGQALIVFAFVMIYASGFAGGGILAGIRLGVLLEIAAIGMRLGFYAVQPFPGKLILYGSASGLIEMIIVGQLSARSTNLHLHERLDDDLASGIGRWTLSVRRWTFVDDLTNSRGSRLSHAGGMGTARRDVAVMAATRGNQFSRILRSRFTGAASNG